MSCLSLGYCLFFTLQQIIVLIQWPIISSYFFFVKYLSTKVISYWLLICKKFGHNCRVVYFKRLKTEKKDKNERKKVLYRRVIAYSHSNLHLLLMRILRINEYFHLLRRTTSDRICTFYFRVTLITDLYDNHSYLSEYSLHCFLFMQK